MEKAYDVQDKQLALQLYCSECISGEVTKAIVLSGITAETADIQDKQLILQLFHQQLLEPKEVRAIDSSVVSSAIART